MSMAEKAQTAASALTATEGAHVTAPLKFLHRPLRLGLPLSQPQPWPQLLQLVWPLPLLLLRW